MANNILIIPGQAKIELHGSGASTTNIQVAANGDIEYVGTTDGLLVSVSETNSLFKVITPSRIEDTLSVGDNYSGSLFGSLNVTTYGVSSGLSFYDGSGTSKRLWVDGIDDSFNITIGSTKNSGFRLASDGEGYLGGNRILTTADSGGGSGLNADTLDSYDSADFTRKIEDATISGNWTFSGSVTIDAFEISSPGDDDLLFSRTGGNDLKLFTDGSTSTNSYLEVGGNRVLTVADEGSGNGIDADTLDTYHASSFPRKDEDATISGNWTFSGTTTIVNSSQVDIGDNIILLNSDETGTPSQNAGFEIERGTSSNVSWLWDETNTYFTPNGQLIGNVADPTLGTHLGDRDYNDARYLNTAGDTLEGNLVIDNTIEINFSDNLDQDDSTRIYRTASDSLTVEYDTADFVIEALGNHDVLWKNSSSQTVMQLDTSAAVLNVNGSRVLTVADEGSGNGIDADTLDGQEGSYYLPAGSYTAADVLAKLLTVDGTGTGLDADLLDGVHGYQFVRTDIGSSINDDVPLYIGNGEGTVRIRSIGSENRFTMTPYDNGTYQDGRDFTYDADEGYWKFLDRLDVLGAMNITGNVTLFGTLSSPADPTLGTHVGDRDYNDGRYARLAAANTLSGKLTMSAGNIIQFNDASDGIQFGSTNYWTINSSGTDRLLITRFNTGGSAFDLRSDESDHTNAWLLIGGNRVLTTADEGSGNGIDADTLDGVEASSFIRSDVTDTFNSDTGLYIGSGEGAIRLFHNTSQNRTYITPYDGGALDFDKELTFSADNGYWEFDDRLDVGANLNVETIAHIEEEVQTQKVSIDDDSDNKKFEIVYNSVSESLDFNFVG